MAISNGIILTPNEGNGNQKVTVTLSSPYTGRTEGSGTATGKVVGGSNSVTVTIKKAPKSEFITLDSSTISAAKGGQTIHLTGKSNSSKLTFTLESNGIGISDITTYKVNTSTTATSGIAITGDPGASAQYTFDVTIVVPANTTVSARSTKVKVTANTTTITQTATINQSAGDAYIYLNTNGTTTLTLTIPQDGTDQTFNVLSNTEWTFTE